MAAFSGLGIGLSLVFGCLLLALAAELYYLLWWKKRIASSEVEYDYNNYAKELIQLFCWKKSASLHATSATTVAPTTVIAITPIMSTATIMQSQQQPPR